MIVLAYDKNLWIGQYFHRVVHKISYDIWEHVSSDREHFESIVFIGKLTFPSPIGQK